MFCRYQLNRSFFLTCSGLSQGGRAWEAVLTPVWAFGLPVALPGEGRSQIRLDL